MSTTFFGVYIYYTDPKKRKQIEEYSNVMAKKTTPVPLVGLVLLMGLLWASSARAEADYLEYKDPNRPINRRIRDLMGRMTLAEKIGQMAQLDLGNVTESIMRDFSIGSVLSGGGHVPRPQATPEDWVNKVNELQTGSLSSRLGIPMIYGIDAVHGHNNVYQATIFPHNVGLGATRLVCNWISYIFN